LAALVPVIDLLPAVIPGYGYAAATDGEGRYLLYLVDARLYRSEPCERQALAVPLSLPPGSYSARTFAPKSGATVELPPLQLNGSARLEIPAFTEDVAVRLERRK